MEQIKGQMSIFDYSFEDFKPQELSNYKIKNPVRLIELFAGVGSQAMALKRLGVPFELYRCIEFDKYPVASYNAIHGTDVKPIDITKISGADLGIIDVDRFTYLLTHFHARIYLLQVNRGE